MSVRSLAEKAKATVRIKKVAFFKPAFVELNEGEGIVFSVIYDKFLNRIDRKRDCVEISGKTLQERCGHQYPFFLNSLREKKLVERVGSYAVGKECFKYRVTCEVKKNEDAYVEKLQEKEKKDTIVSFRNDGDRAHFQVVSSLKFLGTAEEQERFESRDKFSRCKNGRAYTKVVTMEKEDRDKIRFADMEKPYFVDVRNCHASLMATLYPEDSQEKTDYLNFAENFWQNMCALLKVPEHKVKDIFLIQICYDKYKNVRANKYFAMFEKRFPELGGIIIRSKKRDYKALSNRMMALEAKIIMPILYDVLESSEAFTIHDCIACKSDKVEFVTNSIKKSFEENAAKAGVRIHVPE